MPPEPSAKICVPVLVGLATPGLSIQTCTLYVAPNSDGIQYIKLVFHVGYMPPIGTVVLSATVCTAFAPVYA